MLRMIACPMRASSDFDRMASAGLPISGRLISAPGTMGASTRPVQAMKHRTRLKDRDFIKHPLQAVTCSDCRGLPAFPMILPARTRSEFSILLGVRSEEHTSEL